MRKDKTVCCFIGFLAATIIVSFAQMTLAADKIPENSPQEIKRAHPCIAGGAKKTIVYLGVEDKNHNPVFLGTGFLLSYKGYLYVVTAKHVVDGLYKNYKDDDITFFLNTKEGGGQIIKMDWIVRRSNAKWIFSKRYDVAIMPFVAMNNIDYKSIPENFLVTSEDLIELQDVFYISYQPGIESPGKITPIVRSGSVSIINEDGGFVLDAFVFPGNSGSPVFIKPNIFDDEKAKTESCKLIGIVGAYLPYQDVAISAQTNRPRIVFEENTGLAIISPAQALKSIFETDEFAAQHKKFVEQISQFCK
jgi:V8-like Glu-specific endopeptidase